MKWLLVFSIVMLVAMAARCLLTKKAQYHHSSAFHREESPIGYWGTVLMIVAALVTCICLIPKYFSQP